MSTRLNAAKYASRGDGPSSSSRSAPTPCAAKRSSVSSRSFGSASWWFFNSNREPGTACSTRDHSATTPSLSFL
jgi:hypothetical protein